MEQEKLRIILDVAVLIAIFVACAIMIAFLFTALTEGGSCVYNPLGYWETQNNRSIMEICSVKLNPTNYLIQP